MILWLGTDDAPSKIIGHLTLGPYLQRRHPTVLGKVSHRRHLGHL